MLNVNTVRPLTYRQLFSRKSNKKKKKMEEAKREKYRKVY